MIKKRVQPQAPEKKDAELESQVLDHRVSERLPLQLAFTLQTTKEPIHTYRSLTHDISGGGLQGVLKEALQPGTPCTLDIQLDAATSVQLPGMIVRAEKAPTGGWLTAAHFLLESVELPHFRVYSQFIATQLLLQHQDEMDA